IFRPQKRGHRGASARYFIMEILSRHRPFSQSHATTRNRNRNRKGRGATTCGFRAFAYSGRRTTNNKKGVLLGSVFAGVSTWRYPTWKSTVLAEWELRSRTYSRIRHPGSTITAKLESMRISSTTISIPISEAMPAVTELKPGTGAHARTFIGTFSISADMQLQPPGTQAAITPRRTLF